MRGVGVGKDVDNATMRWSWCCLIRNSSVWESLDGPLTACIGLSTPSPPSRRVPSSRYFQPALPRRPGHLAYPVICNYDCFTSLPSCRLSKQYKNQSRPRPSMNLFQRLPLPVLHLGKIPMLGTSKKFLHQFLLLLPDSLLPLFVPILSACYLCGISSVMSQITFGTVGSHFSSDILGRPIMAAITKVTGRSLLNQEAILIWNHDIT